MNNHFKDRLNQKLEVRKKLGEENSNLIDASYLKVVEYTEDSELNKFLFEKSLELMNVQAKTSITLGKIFTEVAEKIEDRTFSTWLESNGYNRMMATRHRRRYDLYSKVREEKKAIIVLLTQREIEQIYRNEMLDYYVAEINRLEKLEEIKEMLQRDILVMSEIVEREPIIEMIDLGDILSRLNNIDIKNIEVSKKLKIESYLKKIEKLLG